MTMIVSGVVLIGLGTMVTGSTGDVAQWARLREARFARETVETELFWSMAAVPSDGYRSAAKWSEATITWTDALGSQTRQVLTYDFRRKHLGTVRSTEGWEDWTGIVFQYYSMAYRFESLQSSNAPRPSFNDFSTGELQAWCSSQANLDRSEILATGVANLSFEQVAVPTGGSSVHWTLIQL
jgi:hypothetical protein